MKLSDSVDIDSCDLIVLAGLDTSQWSRNLPALDASIRKRVSRGAKLIVLNKDKTGHSEIASVSISGDEADALASIAKSLISKGAKAGKEMESSLSKTRTTEETDKVAELLSESNSPVIFCDPSFFNSSRNISLISRSKVVAVPLEANARGVTLAGITPQGKSYSEMLSGGVDTLYVIGEPPVKKKPKVKFLIVQTPYMSGLAGQADIVLPSASYLESKGSIVSYLGRVKKLSRAVSPLDDCKQNKDIFVLLAKALGTTLKESKTDLSKTLKAGAKAKFTPFKKVKGHKNGAEFIESVNRSIIKGSRLLWLKEAEKVGV
jgi:predicted molibdopterin-dependent oxidoreductase YjgC